MNTSANDMHFLIPDVFGEEPRGLFYQYLKEKYPIYNTISNFCSDYENEQNKIVRGVKKTLDFFINEPIRSLEPKYISKLFYEDRFDGVELLFGNCPVFNEKEMDYKRIRKYENYNKCVNVLAGHASFEDHHPVMKNSEFNLAYASKKDAVSMINEQIALLNRLSNYKKDNEFKNKNKIFNMHLGKITDNSFSDELKFNKLEYVSNVLEILNRFAKHHNCVISIENLDVAKKGYNLGSRIEDLRFVFDMNPDLVMAYDTGHVCSVMHEFSKQGNIKDPVSFFRKYQLDYLDAFKDKIVYAHLYYNDVWFNDKEHDPYYGSKGMHLPLTRNKNQDYMYAYEDVLIKLFGIIEKNCGERNIVPCVTLEIPQNKGKFLFFDIEMIKDGATVDEQIRSLESIKLAYHKYRMTKRHT
jgi:hypothetical protein